MYDQVHTNTIIIHSILYSGTEEPSVYLNDVNGYMKINIWLVNGEESHVC